MKKEDLTGLFVYVIMIGIAVLFGFTVLKEYASVSGLGNIFILFVVLAIVVGIVFGSLMLELGHIVGAKVGRYNIDSVNVLGFMFYKKDGKFKFKFGNFDGLSGETKISPKEDASKPSNPSPFLLFPSLFLIVELVIFIVLFVMLNVMSNGDKTSNEARFGYFFLVSAVIGAMILVYNIFPAQLDTINDGYRFKLVSNPKNKEAFNELLRVEKAIQNGEKDVEIKTFDTITNFTADLNLNKVYTLLDKEKYLEAEPFIDSILKSEDISRRVYLRAKAQKIFIMIMTKPLEEVDAYYNKEFPLDERKAIGADVSMESVRAYVLMSGLLDKSESETYLALNHVLKAYKRTSKNRQPIEMKLYNTALSKVIEAHPKWELDGYLLQDK